MGSDQVLKTQFLIALFSSPFMKRRVKIMTKNELLKQLENIKDTFEYELDKEDFEALIPDDMKEDLEKKFKDFRNAVYSAVGYKTIHIPNV